MFLNGFFIKFTFIAALGKLSIQLKSNHYSSRENMPYLSIFLYSLLLTVSSTILPAGTPDRGLPGGAAIQTPPAPGRAQSPRTLSTNRVHHTPLTPIGRRHLTANTRKGLNLNRVIIPDHIRASLHAAINAPVHIDGRLHQHGILLTEQRVAYNYAYNLRNRIVRHRTTDADAFGGNATPILNKQKNEFKHVVPLKTIIDIIERGTTFAKYENGHLQLEIIAEATVFSNDPKISAWLTGVNEIRLTFGYTNDSLDVTDPFLLFHAMVDRRETRSPLLFPVAGVEAYLDDSSHPSRGPILRFRIP